MATLKKPALRGEVQETARAVDLNLDDLEREGKVSPTFRFLLDGHEFHLKDPQEIDWQDLVSALGSPLVFFRETMSEEDLKIFFKTKVPAWKMNALITKYQKHYGLPTAGEVEGLRI